MARQENASYEGKNQRTPIDIKKMIAALTSQETGYPTARYLDAPSDIGFCTDQYGNFRSKNDTEASSSWNVLDNSGRSLFKVNAKTGDVTVLGGLNGSNLLAGSTGWAALQSHATDGTTKYRLQLQNGGALNAYKSTDGGATWTTYPFYFNSQPLRFWQKLQAYDGKNSRDIIKVYDDGDEGNYGSELIISGSGNTYIGAGESASALYTANGVSAGEQMYVCSDNNVHLVAACNTIANRKSAILSSAAFYPATNGTFTLGTGSLRWGQVYSTASAISTSDRNQKHDVTELDEEQAIGLIMGAIPVTYKYNDGTSGRAHWGLIAQDIEELLEKVGIDSAGFAGFIKSPKEKIIDERTGEIGLDLDEDGNVQYEYGLRYEEFVAPLIRTVQAQQKKIESLEERLAKLEKMIGGEESAMADT